MAVRVKRASDSPSNIPRSGRGFTNRRLWTAVSGLLLVGVAVVILFATGLFYLERGVANLQRARSHLTSLSGAASVATTLSQARGAVTSAQADFDRADWMLGAVRWPAWALGWVPVVGPKISAVPAVAHMAHETTSGIGDLLTAAQPVVQAWTAHGKRHSLSSLLGAIVAQRSRATQACGHLDAAATARRTLSTLQVQSLGAQIRTFDKETQRMRTACRVFMLLPGILGYSAPRTYLVAYQDQFELKATGGFIGSTGLLRVNRGHVKQLFLGSWFNHQNLSVPPPEPMLLYNHEPAWLFMDSNWSPDFPTTAALERLFADLDLHRQVQGVIDVTSSGVADVLRATGPVYVPEYHTTVTAQNVAQLADHYTHRSRYFGPLRFQNKNTERQQFIGIVGSHILSRLTHLSLHDMQRMAGALQNAIRTRDLLINFNSPRDQALLRLVGATGAINPTSGDYLYVVNTNLSYNKINTNVLLSTRYRASVSSTGWVNSVLTIRITNVPFPHFLEEAKGPGAGRLGGWDDYASFLRIYVPLGAQIASQSGWTQPWSPGNAYGKTMFCGYVIVPRGTTREVRLRYLIPPNVFSSSRGSRYSLVIQHQPGSYPVVWRVQVRPPDGTPRSWVLRHPRTDARLVTAVHLHTIQPIPLPLSARPVVAPGTWIEPHAYLGMPKT